MAVIISGTGSYIPLVPWITMIIAKLVETSDEWIRERTGVVRRHVIREETTGVYGGQGRTPCAGAGGY